jgi:hypothetical protein
VSAQKPVLVIVHGRPATGKTTIARSLAQSLNIPLIAKDDIKELLFDSLGWSDRAWSKKLGAETYDLLFYFAETILKTKSSLMVESNFSQGSTPFLEGILERAPYHPVQVICQADTKTSIERFRERGEAGRRHPGHVDPTVIEEMSLSTDKGPTAPLPLDGDIIEVDTNDFQSIDLESVVERLSLILGPRDAAEAKTPEQ